MGTSTAPDRAFALHDSNRRPVPLEFSVAAVFPSGPRNLRGRSIATRGGVGEPGYSGAWTRHFDESCRVKLPHGWFLRFAAHLDFSRTGFGLGLFGIPPTQLRIALVGIGGD